ncbi:hypothetical protein Pmani_007916 [Petrolisthes manimaculis]|uniref:CIP2A N-terminal domain-containing protein n=1 Tax=Petrolisthes manimaculis TaxID=1843537 RepID=A0AAE1Q6I0_9EUCA|nr:hypothetical protein Pmani_007916 [Petrolisthes manimaculis]
MGTENLQIKNFLHYANKFQHGKIEKNHMQLLRHLQILSMVSDMEIFEPTSIETLEFYLYLEQYLSPTNSTSSLAYKVITLLAHVCESKAVCSALRDDIKMVPIISNFFLNSKLSRDKSLKTLYLIQKLSYNIKIVQTEAWVIKLVPHLIKIIIDADLGDDLLIPALHTVANLCRANRPVLHWLHATGNKKALLQKLMDMRTATIDIRLLATEVMFYTQALLPAVDAMSTHYLLDTVFAAATNGLGENNAPLLRHATDVFGELISCPSIEEYIRGYERYGESGSLLLGLLVHDTPEPLVEAVLELLCFLLQLEHQHVLPLTEEIFSKAGLWLHSESCGTASVKVLQSLSNSGKLNSEHWNDSINILKVLLSPKESLTNSGQLHHLTALLVLVQDLCQKDASIHLKLALQLHPSSFLPLLKKILDIGGMSQGCTSDFSSGIDASLIPSSRQIPNTTTTSSFKTYSSPSSFLSVNDPRASVSQLISQAVVMVLCVVKLLGSHNAEFMLEFTQMLNIPGVMKHLVATTRTNNTEFVARSITLLSEGTVPKESLMELISAAQEANACDPSLQDQSTSNNAISSLDHTNTNTMRIQSPVLFSPACEEGVDDVIFRLKSAMDKMELRDCTLTDIIELYECKVAALVNKEASLHNILTASDALNHHNHHFLLQTRVQNDRLRALLYTREQLLQQTKQEKDDIESTISQMIESANTHRENFRIEKTALERQKTEVKREVASLKDSLDNKDDKISKLQKQLSEAGQEVKNLMKLNKEEQERSHKAMEQIQKFEEELKRRRRELEELVRDNQRVEKEKGKLRDEIKELEMLIRSHEESMAAKETELEEVTKKYQELKRLQDMIHNISSGKLGNMFDPGK